MIIKIFVTDINEIIKRRDFYENRMKDLSSQDKSRYAKIENEKRRLQFLTGRFLIKEHLKRDFTIEKNGHLSSDNIFLSLTHTDHLVMLALYQKPVGIDMENLLKVRNFNALSKHLGFAPSTDPDIFYRNFTAYEADYKLGKENLPANHLFFYYQNFVICISTKEMPKNIDIYDCIPFISCKKIKSKLK